MIVNFIVTATLIFSVGVNAQQLSREDYEKIDNFLKEATTCHATTGLLVSVVRGGQAVFTKGYGLAVDDDEDATNNWAADADTIFPIASVSKHFTSAIIGHVMQNTSYDWDTSYRKMAKELFNEDMYFSEPWRTNHTSLKDLLAHRMGTSGQDVMLAVDQWTKQELMERIRFLRPNADFRNSYFYNNIMYSVAAYLAERHAGKDWDELLRDNFFIKLGMTNTSTIRLGQATNYSGWARPHINLGDIVNFNFSTGPFDMSLFRGVANAGAGAGGIATTANDMAKWMNYMLDYKNRPDILNPDINTQIRKGVQSRNSPPNPENTKPHLDFTHASTSYGLGINNGFYRGHPMLSHGGSLVIYTSHYALLPHVNIGVFVASNQPELYLEEIRMFIFDVLLGIEHPWMNITRFCSLGLDDNEPETYKDEGHTEDFGLRYGIESMLKTIKPYKLKTLSKKLKNKNISMYKPNKNAYALVKTIKELPNIKKRSTIMTKHQKKMEFDKYTGTFGNFAYGNLTIELYPGDDFPFDGDLMITYGWLELTLTRFENGSTVVHPDLFEMTVVELYEPTPDKVRFWSSKGDGTIDRMELSLDPADGPYSWARDLKYADAPPPSDGSCSPGTPPPPPVTPCPPRSGATILTSLMTSYYIACCVAYILIKK